MGMDIHFHVEYKDEIEEVWLADITHVEALRNTAPGKYIHGGFDMGRDSTFFRYMIKKLNRGLPPDMSDTIKKIHENNDNVGVFGVCHCNLYEYKKCIADYNALLLVEDDEVVNDNCFIFESGDDVSSFIKIIKHVEKALLATDVRFVFWFDV